MTSKLRRGCRGAAFGLVWLLCGLLPVLSQTTLTELYDRARDYDPLLVGARLNRDIVSQRVVDARAGAQPQVAATIEASQIYQDLDLADAGANTSFRVGSDDFLNTNYTITLTQPIYRAEVLARIPQARAELREAELALIEAEQDLMVRIASLYFDLLAAQEQVDLSTTELRAIQRQLQESQQRFASGLGTPGDVQEAQARFAIAQAEEIEAVGELEVARLSIAEVAGIAPDSVAALSDAFPLAGPEQPDVQSWVGAATFQNPGVRALQARVDVASEELRVQRSTQLPSLDFVASVGYADNEGSEFTGERQTETTNLSVQARIPIFDGGRGRSTRRSAALQLQVAMQRVERLRRRVELDTRSAFQAVTGGIRRVEALRQSVFAQEAALLSREEGLRAGVSTGSDVLDARRDLFSARVDLAESRYDYIVNSLRLKQLSGILSIEDLRRIDAYLQ